MHSDGRAVISDFELAFNIHDVYENQENSRQIQGECNAYISPEVYLTSILFF